MLCNWLSRTSFEVAIVDHTGLDLVAYNTKIKQRLGITVKSRTRKIGKETDEVNIFSYRRNDRQKLTDACKFFCCDPFIAIYVETKDVADLYLTSLKNYDRKYRPQKGQALDTWKMSSQYIERYKQDKEVMHIRVDFHLDCWWSL